ncbi:MAG: hypothetical protein R3C43_19130 [Chloroflexota bacterium]
MKKKAIPLGRGLDTSDEALDALAVVTPGDIEAAQADAARNMPALGRALLEADRADDAAEEEAV